MIKCPLCEQGSIKVLYMGIPLYLCRYEHCNHVFGFWSFLIEWIPFNGIFIINDEGYLQTLWIWLTGQYE